MPPIAIVIPIANVPRRGSFCVPLLQQVTDFSARCRDGLRCWISSKEKNALKKCDEAQNPIGASFHDYPLLASKQRFRWRRCLQRRPGWPPIWHCVVVTRASRHVRI